MAHLQVEAYLRLARIPFKVTMSKARPCSSYRQAPRQANGFLLSSKPLLPRAGSSARPQGKTALHHTREGEAAMFLHSAL